MNMGIISGSRLRASLGPSINLFGNFSGGSKWVGGVLAPNGKIYAIPRDARQILEINPVNRTTTLFGQLIDSGERKWAGGVLAQNGKIYGIPLNQTQVLEIDPSNNNIRFLKSFSGGNKWFGGVLAPNGKIYCIPFSTTQILVIDNVDTPNIIGSDANIPASLANLATSNYNEYYNKL